MRREDICDTLLTLSHSCPCVTMSSYVKKYAKPPECDDNIIRCTSRRFDSWCPGSTSPKYECSQGTSWEKRVIYGGLYQHRRVNFVFINTQPEISFKYCIIAKRRAV